MAASAERRVLIADAPLHCGELTLKWLSSCGRRNSDHAGPLRGDRLIRLNSYAIVSVVQSNGVSTGKKVVWIILILFLPVLGWIIWWLAGPRSR